MSTTWLHLSTAFNITAPLVVIACLGMACRVTGLVDQRFVLMASKLVFTLSLPCLLFMLVLGADWSDTRSYTLIGYSLANTLLITALALLASRMMVNNPQDRGIFVQGVFRSNMGVVSLALIGSAYGTEGLSLAAVPITLNTLLYNIIAVVILRDNDEKGRSARREALLGVLRNPLILAIAAGLVAVMHDLQLPKTLKHSGELLSQLALPLALLCVGASLQLNKLTQPDKVATWASIGKLIVAPAIAVPIAYFVFGFQGMPLGILFFMTASPAATAGFAMVVAVGGNAQLSAQMIALTTVASVLTLGIGTFFLKYWGLI